QERRFTEARAAFERARSLLPDKPNAYRWLGLTDARLGRCQDAVANLDSFLGRVPSTDPRVAEVQMVRERCQEELHPKGGTLVIESTPSGAEVTIDDRGGPSLGRTPYRVTALAMGTHKVRLRKPGYADLEKTVQLGQGET